MKARVAGAEVSGPGSGNHEDPEPDLSFGHPILPSTVGAASSGHFFLHSFCCPCVDSCCKKKIISVPPKHAGKF